MTEEMPKYKSHKTVWALKIKSLSEFRGDGSRVMEPCEAGFGGVELSPEYCKQHKPKEGGYYVVYQDGYQSFSPAEPFESGYTAIER